MEFLFHHVYDVFMSPREAEKLIKEIIDKIKNHEISLHEGCVACHVLFSLKKQSGRSEQDSADLLSDILTNNANLNSEFIEVVEQVHMKERNLGPGFVSRDRSSKDSYLETYFSNVLDELSSDLNFASYEIILRKLLLSYLALYLAQTIGVDYHAATEELYYLLRKDESKNFKIARLISRFEEKIKTRG